MKLLIEITKEAWEHGVSEVEQHTDEGTDIIPFPPSKLYSEFIAALTDAQVLEVDE